MADQDNLSPEEIATLRSFKKKMFDLYWETYGTFYLHALPHPNLDLGKRGLVGEEKENGIILVFGPKAVRSLEIREDHLFAELQFGYNWDSLFIPWDSLFRLYDKTQNAILQMKVILNPIQENSPPEQVKEGNVIRIQFGDKKPKPSKE